MLTNLKHKERMKKIKWSMTKKKWTKQFPKKNVIKNNQQISICHQQRWKLKCSSNVKNVNEKWRGSGRHGRVNENRFDGF